MKKAQAAMEFLMTYGWAILVVLAAIGALAYFGVLSPDRFMPSKCMITGGFSCVEYKVDSSGVYINVQNNLGVDADIVNITLAGEDPNSACSGTNATGGLDNGEKTGLITFSCSPTGKFKGDITVLYRKSGETVTHTTTGSIVSQVES
ncbi:MAG TPA: hypothetical protein ENL16_01780 [Candidatus Woesearchaeota archaeon]|nr:hypothetical protein [Candidatus Woesearchaeota archaeon]